MHDFSLRSKQLIIWVITLDKIKLFPNWISLLSLDEHKRTYSYSFKKDQELFIRSRLALRLLLSKYLMILPQEIIFEYERVGKPYVAKNDNLRKVEFNLSRRDEILVIGITLDCPIGIDIESITHVNGLLIDESIFTGYECIQMRDYPMYNFWVAKEAYLKMTGCGLRHPLNDIQIDMKANLAVKLSTQQNAHLTFFNYDGKFAGAVSCESLPNEVFLKILDLDQLGS